MVVLVEVQVVVVLVGVQLVVVLVGVQVVVVLVVGEDLVEVLKVVLGEAGEDQGVVQLAVEDQTEVLAEVFVEVQNQVAVAQVVHLTVEQVEV